MPKVKSKKFLSRKGPGSDEEPHGNQVPEEYVVEKVVKRKIRKSKVFYLIKWEGYPHEFNTWELEENCNCPDLIQQFEAIMLENAVKVPSPEKDKDTDPAKIPCNNEASSDSLAPVFKKSGFERGLEAERILGATEQHGKLIFLIKWKDSAEEDLVFAEEANVNCPQVVINFYESKLTWRKSASETEASTEEGT